MEGREGGLGKRVGEVKGEGLRLFLFVCFWGGELGCLINHSKVWILFYSDQPQSWSCFYFRTFALAIPSN